MESYMFFDLEDKDFADGKNIAYLCAFRVRKEYRRQGNGSRLMTNVLTKLKEIGFSTLLVQYENQGLLL